MPTDNDSRIVFSHDQGYPPVLASDLRTGERTLVDAVLSAGAAMQSPEGHKHPFVIPPAVALAIVRHMAALTRSAQVPGQSESFRVKPGSDGVLLPAQQRGGELSETIKASGHLKTEGDEFRSAKAAVGLPPCLGVSGRRPTSQASFST